MTGPDPGRAAWRPSGIPVLHVGDIGKAVAYYRRFFRFEPVSLDVAAGLALVRGHGVSLLLAGEDAGRLSQDGSEPAIPDAALVVESPDRMRWELDDLGAHLLPAGELGRPWQHFFGFRDCYGNVLAAGPAAGPLPAVRRRASQPAEAIKFRLREQQRARLEARHRAGFRKFYEGLADTRDIYYLLVTTGLLHWAAKAASYVPGHVNLVLLGTELQPDELAWARDQAGRPFHHVGLRLDEPGAWEFLFDVNRRSFGWIDPGCFVLNDQLFEELARIESRTAVNCAWSWDSGQEFAVASTHLAFVNIDAVRAVRRPGVHASPGIYAYQRLNRQVEGRRCYARRPSRPEIRMLRGVLPGGPSGRPSPPGGLPYFDTLVMYQLLARQRGFGVARIRGLEALGHVRGRATEDEASDELFYIGALSYADALEEFSGYFHDESVRLLYLIAEYMTLAETAAGLPESYRHRLDQVTAMLRDHGLDHASIVQAARHHLTGTAGLSAAAALAVLGQ
jgi:hypothetical protein